MTEDIYSTIPTKTLYEILYRKESKRFSIRLQEEMKNMKYESFSKIRDATEFDLYQKEIMDYAERETQKHIVEMYQKYY